MKENIFSLKTIRKIKSVTAKDLEAKGINTGAIYGIEANKEVYTSSIKAPSILRYADALGIDSDLVFYATGKFPQWMCEEVGNYALFYRSQIKKLYETPTNIKEEFCNRKALMEAAFEKGDKI